MESITIDQAQDILTSTLQAILKKRVLMTYVYTSYNLFNSLWQDRSKIQGGDKIEAYITLEDEGNFKHRSNWEEDTHNVVNTDHTIQVDWKTASNNFSYNVVEMSMNRGAAQIYNKVESKMNNTLREMVDGIYAAAVSTPNSSSDSTKPFGLSAWFPLGTDDSTGDWTGSTGSYGDSNTFNPGGINATTYPRWKSYYADHDGDLDDSLLVLLDRATRKLNFEGPMYPKALDDTGRGSGKFTLYSNDNVIGSINLLYAKSDDQMGYRINSHFGRPPFKGMVFQYCSILDTADTTRYGTDPIIGVNHELTYPVILNEWDFKVGKPRQRDQQHLVLTVDLDLVYGYICENRQFGGFLISQQ